jgi:cyanophycinase
MKPQVQKKNSCPVPRGSLLIIGGAENKDVSNSSNEKEKTGITDSGILESFFKITSSDTPVIELITTASSSDPEDIFNEYKESFESYGNCTVNHIHHDGRNQVNVTELADRLNKAHGVFFSGGDQLKITSVYGGTEFLRLIKERYIFDDFVIAGTSAGAMAMSTPMIYAGVGRNEMIAGNVKITTGLEFLKDVCIDTHFVDRGRFVRMAQVIATNPSIIGMGIEEDTAILVKNGVEGTVIGSGVIIIITGVNSSETNVTEFNDEKLISIRGLNVDILSRGDFYTIPQMNPPHQ